MVTELAPQPLVIPDSTLPYPPADDIIAAFRVTGLKPARGAFFLYDSCSERRVGACAIGVLAYQRASEYDLSRSGAASVMQDVSLAWQQGVVDGFDGNMVSVPGFTTTDDYVVGYATGQAVARWAFGEPQ